MFDLTHMDLNEIRKDHMYKLMRVSTICYVENVTVALVQNGPFLGSDIASILTICTPVCYSLDVIDFACVTSC